MRYFAGFVAIYLVAGLGGAALVGGGSLAFLKPMLVQFAVSAVTVLPQAIVVIGALLLLQVAAPRSRRLLARLPAALGALALSLVFIMTFTLIKTSLPALVPFFADPFFAQIDRALHGGRDPFELAHGLAGWLPAGAVALFYLQVWLLPATLLPFLLVLIDDDRRRVGRFLVLYVAVWVGLGNLLALAGMSAGPVYYDRLEGGERFAALAAGLARTGLTDSPLGEVQELLWQAYLSGIPSVGTGISAFPSVHVGMATVLSLYLWERSRWLALPAVGFAGAILFLSVYSGWHYAVDGYASMVLVGLLWVVLRRREAAQWQPRREAVVQ